MHYGRHTLWARRQCLNEHTGAMAERGLRAEPAVQQRLQHVGVIARHIEVHRHRFRVHHHCRPEANRATEESELFVCLTHILCAYRLSPRYEQNFKLEESVSQTDALGPLRSISISYLQLRRICKTHAHPRQLA